MALPSFNFPIDFHEIGFRYIMNQDNFYLISDADQNNNNRNEHQRTRQYIDQQQNSVITGRSRHTVLRDIHQSVLGLHHGDESRRRLEPLARNQLTQGIAFICGKIRQRSSR